MDLLTRSSPESVTTLLKVPSSQGRPLDCPLISFPCTTYQIVTSTSTAPHKGISTRKGSWRLRNYEQRFLCESIIPDLQHRFLIYKHVIFQVLPFLVCAAGLTKYFCYESSWICSNWQTVANVKGLDLALISPPVSLRNHKDKKESWPQCLFHCSIAWTCVRSISFLMCSHTMSFQTLWPFLCCFKKLTMPILTL